MEMEEVGEVMKGILIVEVVVGVMLWRKVLKMWKRWREPKEIEEDKKREKRRREIENGCKIYKQ